MNTIKIEIDEKTLRRLVLDYLSELTSANLKIEDIKIETKSSQNYKAEWETAEFRASVNKVIV